MKIFVLAILSLVLAGAVAAAPCKVEADSRKLECSAWVEFLSKCEAEAKTRCESSAAEMRLQRAAKDSFTKKCIEDAVDLPKDQGPSLKASAAFPPLLGLSRVPGSEARKGFPIQAG